VVLPTFSQLKKRFIVLVHMQEKKKIYPLRAVASRCQPQQTRTATYTNASYRHFKVQKLKATKNKLIPEFCTESSSSFEQISKITT
jgi:hypothetical protein